MKSAAWLLILIWACSCFAGTKSESRLEAEYYVDTYARHYGLPIEFVRAIVEQESGWHRRALSSKGAVGLMQLMPETAKKLGVSNRNDLNQNVSGGVRLLAWLTKRFHGDLRLVAAAYYAGISVVDARGLKYANPDVVTYVASIRARVERQTQSRSGNPKRISGRTP
jgi:soluble lytic murein transglycosylase-like protein